MGCRFSDFHGKCSLNDGLIEIGGVDEKGNCICEEDVDPTILCGEYYDDGVGYDDEDDENNLDLDDNEEE